MLPNDEFVSQQALSELLTDDDGGYPVFGKSSKSLFSILFTADGTFKAKSRPGTLRNLDYPISSELTNKQQSYTYSTSYMGSFQVDIYIHPTNVRFDVSSEDLRNKYLANIGVYWGSPNMAHATTANLNVNINDAAQDLFKNFNGEIWQMSINITKL